VLDAATKEQRRVAVDLMGYPTVAQRNKNEVIKCALPTCSNRLRGKQRMYCSNSHASQHRNERNRAEERAIIESEVMGQIRETVAPVVREMLTERVLNELNVLVNAIPRAAETIVRDLDDPDPDVHQKAATLLLKYTMRRRCRSSSECPSRAAPPRRSTRRLLRFPRLRPVRRLRSRTKSRSASAWNATSSSRRTSSWARATAARTAKRS
jgi:hypothetical protein